MTPERQRIAIAEACGWKHILKDPVLFRGTPPWSDNDGLHEIPDYLSDLNAMHEAEKVLDSADWIRYHRKLRSIIMESGRAQSQEVSATAAQRAEAFLRTLNLWSE